MSAFYDQASLVVVPSGYKSGKIYAQKPLTTDGQLTFTRASTATRVNASGLIEEVASGVPRLDYLNSSCPRLLLEPQRTNLVTYSEYIADSSWVPINATITSNYGTSPEGVQNSSRIVCSNTTNSRLFISYGGTLTDGTVYTWSGWYKGTAGEKVVINAISSGGSAVNASKVITFTGDWQRENVTFTAGTSLTYVFANDARVGSDTTATDFEYFGAQLEAGAYATSYIPTLGAAVTRVADAASKTGISSLIGQTEGTLYGEFDMSLTGATSGSRKGLLFLSDGTFNNRIEVTKLGGLTATVADDIHIRITAGGVNQFDIKVKEDVTGLQKIAFAYKSGETACYINGVQLYTNSSAISIPSTSFYQIGDAYSTPAGEPVNQALLFKTRLSNADLATLTSL